MEKVKLTTEQAKAIKIVMRDTNQGLTRPNMETQLKKEWKNEPFSTLNSLTVEEFIKAILGEYVVETEYKLDEWIVAETDEKGPYVGQITDIDRLEGTNIWFTINNKGVTYRTSAENVRHATPEEIEKEKQRRWWEENNREVWELSKGDCLISKHDEHSCQVKFVEGVDEESVLLVDGNKDEFYECINDLQTKYKVFCFAEDRKG